MKSFLFPLLAFFSLNVTSAFAQPKPWCHIQKFSKITVQNTSYPVHFSIDYQISYDGSFEANPVWANVHGLPLDIAMDLDMDVIITNKIYNNPRSSIHLLPSGNKLTGKLSRQSIGPLSDRFGNVEFTQNIEFVVNGESVEKFDVQMKSCPNIY